MVQLRNGDRSLIVPGKLMTRRPMLGTDLAQGRFYRGALAEHGKAFACGFHFHDVRHRDLSGTTTAIVQLHCNFARFRTRALRCEFSRSVASRVELAARWKSRWIRHGSWNRSKSRGV